MRLLTVIAVVGLSIVGFATVRAGAPPADAPSQGGVTLLGTLAEWQYPGSKMPGGATMSDGGVPLVQSVKFQAILTTADPVEKVIAFYAEKLGTPRSPGPEDARAKGADAKSVSTQDDSRGRPVALRVIVVNKAESSTTLVISRAEGEEETHIAWSHYLRLDGKR
jgi:hypothetical protein